MGQNGLVWDRRISRSSRELEWRGFAVLGLWSPVENGMRCYRQAVRVDVVDVDEVVMDAMLDHM
jgi:hypothetical protein